LDSERGVKKSFIKLMLLAVTLKLNRSHLLKTLNPVRGVFDANSN